MAITNRIQVTGSMLHGCSLCSVAATSQRKVLGGHSVMLNRPAVELSKAYFIDNQTVHSERAQEDSTDKSLPSRFEESSPYHSESGHRSESSAEGAVQSLGQTKAQTLTPNIMIGKSLARG
jgi:hypothetical protein